MIVTYQDAKEMAYCNKGLRDFFTRHNLDYQDFRENGIDAEKFLQTGDMMAIDLVNYAMSKVTE